MIPIETNGRILTGKYAGWTIRVTAPEFGGCLVLYMRAEGADPATLTPRQWQARHSDEVAQRRGYVLAQLAGKLGT